MCTCSPCTCTHITTYILAHYSTINTHTHTDRHTHTHMHTHTHACTHTHTHMHTHTIFDCHVQLTDARCALTLTGTHYSCIIRVGAGTAKMVGRTATLVQIQLCPYTRNTVIPRWTTSSSKCSISRSFNGSWVAQLTAHNYSISKAPVVIAHSSPMAKEKDLNTTF